MLHHMKQKYRVMFHLKHEYIKRKEYNRVNRFDSNTFFSKTKVPEKDDSSFTGHHGDVWIRLVFFKDGDTGDGGNDGDKEDSDNI